MSMTQYLEHIYARLVAIRDIQREIIEQHEKIRELFGGGDSTEQQTTVDALAERLKASNDSLAADVAAGQPTT